LAGSVSRDTVMANPLCAMIHNLLLSLEHVMQQ
jgi:hypothetical protein